MGVWSGVAGALDHAAGSVDEAVGRQFDDTQGGGVSDEFGAVVDPTQGGSGQTERDILGVAGVLGETGVQSGQTYVGFSRLLAGADILGGTTPSQVDRAPDDETPDGDGALWSGDIGTAAENTWNAVTPSVPIWVWAIGGLLTALVAIVAVGQLFNVTVPVGGQEG